jgi:hypothetical protein
VNNIEPASELSATLAALRRRRALLVVFTLLLIPGAILLSIATRMTPHVRQRAITAMNERFKSNVDLGSLQISVFPRPEIPPRMGESVLVLVLGHLADEFGAVGAQASDLRASCRAG